MAESLHTIVARIEERQISIYDKMGAIKEWQESHERHDDIKFKEINDNINSMNKYMVSIAIVAGSIGAFGSYLWDRVTGKI